MPTSDVSPRKANGWRGVDSRIAPVLPLRPNRPFDPRADGLSPPENCLRVAFRTSRPSSSAAETDRWGAALSDPPTAGRLLASRWRHPATYSSARPLTSPSHSLPSAARPPSHRTVPPRLRRLMAGSNACQKRPVRSDLQERVHTLGRQCTFNPGKVRPRANRLPPVLHVGRFGGDLARGRQNQLAAGPGTGGPIGRAALTRDPLQGVLKRSAQTRCHVLTHTLTKEDCRPDTPGLPKLGRGELNREAGHLGVDRRSGRHGLAKDAREGAIQRRREDFSTLVNRGKERRFGIIEPLSQARARRSRRQPGGMPTCTLQVPAAPRGSARWVCRR